MDFTDSELEKLVATVQLFPCIYDMTLSSYRSKFLKYHAWQKIAAEMKTNVEICQKKWKSVKDKYRRYKATDPSIRNHWDLASALKFVDEFVTTRKGYNFKKDISQELSGIEMTINDGSFLMNNSLVEEGSTVPELQSSATQDSICVEIEAMKNSLENSTTNDSESTMSSNSKRDFKNHLANKRKRQFIETEKHIDDLFQTEKVLQAFKHSNYTKEDEDFLFFASVAVKVKDMDHQKKSKLQLKIMKEVHKALYDEEV